MLLAMKANHRVVHPQQDLDVVVVLPGVSAAAAAHGLVDLLGHGVESPGYIQLGFCAEIRGGGICTHQP